MPLPEYFAYSWNKEASRVTIVALSLTLEQEHFDPGLDLFVFADVLTLPPTRLSLPGKQIVIYARKLICNGGTIDVSGSAPPPPLAPMNPPQAAAATGPGQNGPAGQDGAAGSRGSNAGSVHIFAGEASGKQTVNANGGQGQTGQKGQRGGNGATGAPGRDAIILPPVKHTHRRDWEITAATAGDRGGNGGQGGAAGKPGDGGDAGAVMVYLRKPGGQFTFSTKAGEPGNGALAGEGGIGGPGGLGGLIAVRDVRSQHIQTETWVLSRNERQGGAQAGSAGKGGADGPAARYGAANSGAVVRLDDVRIHIGEPVFIAQHLLTLHQANLYYLAGRFAEAHELYAWEEWLMTRSNGLVPATAGEIDAIQKQARSMLNQLRQGLDFFGNPLDRVPIVELDRYQTTLTGMLILGTQVESTYQQYSTMLRTKEKQFADYNTALDQAGKVIEQYTKDRDAFSGQLLQLETTINQLNDSQTRQYAVLMAAEAAFRQAVEHQGEGCTFGNLLDLLQSIVVIAENAFGVVNAIQSISALSIDPKNITGAAGKLVKQVKAVTGGASNIGAAWNEIKGLNPASAPDTAKLIIKQEEFDAAIAPYLDLPAARHYQAVVHDYVSIIQSRNAKLLEYTNALVALSGADSAIAQKTAELERIRGDAASKSDPTLAPFRAFMLRLYEDLRFTCLKLLYKENQAYRYWSLKASPFEVADNVFAQLNAFHVDLSKKILEAIDIGTPRQPVTIRIRLTPADRPKQFEEFRKSGSLTFSVPIDEPSLRPWRQVLFDRFTISIANARTSAERIYVQLWHRGRVAVFDQRDRRHDFSHEQVLAAYQYGGDLPPDGGNLGGEGRIALSPFASWTISLPAKYNAGIDLSAADQVELIFKGFALPSPMAKKSAS